MLADHLEERGDVRAGHVRLAVAVRRAELAGDGVQARQRRARSEALPPATPDPTLDRELGQAITFAGFRTGVASEASRAGPQLRAALEDPAHPLTSTLRLPARQLFGVVAALGEPLPDRVRTLCLDFDVERGPGVGSRVPSAPASLSPMRAVRAVELTMRQPVAWRTELDPTPFAGYL
ncbi:MAG: hypothetical protein AAF211_28985, partial [Myxococcota bacterium]